MARFTRNSVEGKSDENRSGWRARQQKARLKREAAGMSRAEIAAIRRAHAQAAQVADEVAFNPQVQTTAQAGPDFVSQMSDADLVALYKQLHEGRAPNGKAKRSSVERAVRAKQAERAAEKAAYDAEFQRGRASYLATGLIPVPTAENERDPFRLGAHSAAVERGDIPVGEGNSELTLEQLADDGTVEGDDV